MNAPAKIGEVPPVDLDALARRINLELNSIVDAAKGVVTKAIAAGEALNQAKAAIADGQWLRWLSTNTSVSERTAQLYMQLAEYKRQKLTWPS